MTAADKLIVALDVDDISAAEKIVKHLYPTVKNFKVGSQLFTACGPDSVRMVRRSGAGVFLDLKFHDIPNTIANASRLAARLGASMFNVHASAGLLAMESAKKSSQDEARRLKIAPPVVLGVTVLTSMNGEDLKRLGIKRKVEAQALFLAELARDAGLDGVVASGAEAAIIRKSMGEDFIIVTPGIRPKEAAKGDQKRVFSALDAIRLGADYVVCGRPVIEARDPLCAAKEIIKEIKIVTNKRTGN